MEEWKEVPEYPGYKISSFGNVFSKKLKRIIKAPESNDKDGYCRIGLCYKQEAKKFHVHRLVAQAFIPNPENKATVNHKDGNKQNNHVDNLEWNTMIENLRHAREVLNVNNPMRKGNSMRPKIPVILLKDDVEYSFESTRDAQSFLRCSGQSWKVLMQGNINGYTIKNVSS
jgi:hypothetical protein